MNPEPEIFKVSFPVLVSQTDTNGMLTITSLADMMQEAAALHADQLGWGFEAMRNDHQAWFLRNLRIRYLRPVSWKENLTVNTWPLPPERLIFQRDYRVYNSEKVVVAEGSSGWMLINTDKMRPVDGIPGHFKTLHFCKDRVFSDFFPKIPAMQTQEKKMEFKVNYRSLDLNGHVNHVNYLRWMMDVYHAGSLTLVLPVIIHLKFQQAMMQGDEGTVSIAPEPGSGRFLFKIIRQQDQAEVIRAELSEG